MRKLLFVVGAVGTVVAACGSDKEVVTATSTSASSSGSTSSVSSTSSGGASSSSSAGGAGGSGGGGASTGTGGFMTAPHAPFPKTNKHGGTILSNVDLVTVNFKGDPRIPLAQAFGDHIVGSAWYTDVGKDYGVGAGKHLAKFVFPEATPSASDDPQVLALIDAHIKDGTLPPIGPQTLYMIYVPKSVTYGNATDGFLCTDSYGYHYSATVSSGEVIYAIIGDCGSDDDLTSTAAHELIESATDPTDGYYIDGPSNNPWSYLPEGTEVGDLCEFLPIISDGTYGVQRSWSDAAAAAGTDPCIPVPQGEVYFNVTAKPAALVSVAAGGSVKFDITGWSLGPTADWPIFAEADVWDFKPDVQLVGTSINNGVTTTLTLTVPPGTKPNSIGIARVYSDPNYGVYWPVGVVVK